MRRAALPLPAAAWLIAAAFCVAQAQPIALEQRVVHPSGAALLLRTLEPRADSVVIAAAITNPTDGEIRLNDRHSFVLVDDAHGVHRLNPPPHNPDLRIDPHTQAEARLLFIGPLPPTAHRLAMSTNEGVGTADNPYDNLPVLRAVLSLPTAGSAAGTQANHPDGAALWIDRAIAGIPRCAVAIHATNGNDRTIALNQDRSLSIADRNGASVRIDPPADNVELVVPPGDRLDGDLVFDCRNLDTGGELTLATNRDTGGTRDNPYDTLPVFVVRMTAQPSGAGNSVPMQSRATVVPLPRSELAETTAIAQSGTAPGHPAASPAAAIPAPPPVRATVSTAPAAASPALPPSGRQEPPKSVTELEAALHAAQGYEGLNIVLPADALFGVTGATLAPASDPVLADIAALIAALQPRGVIVAGHTDSAGNDSDNMTLSQQRADAVAGWLLAHLRSHRPRLVAEGFGRTRPAAPNHKADGSDDPEGRAQNRRIEITLER